MANLPNNNEFALAAEAAPDNMNGWVEEEDPEMEEEEEDPEEDPEMEEEEEDMDADEQWDGPEWILPYQGAGPLYPSPPASDSEDEAEAEAEAEVAPIPPPVPANPIHEVVPIGTSRLIPLKRLFTNTQVWMGSSSSAVAAGHNPEDLTPSHIRSDLDALHRRVTKGDGRYVAMMGLEAANQIGWTEMRRLMTEELCPIEEVQQMEHELWNLKVKEFDLTAYTKRFH
ncbi:hypothetical protein Tco_0860995 [Tanacetum coccineum]|uniref:Uncharacterized protein n=1 Tax=Tanacetum coccineum TaxID=301880 RepID=A0ABQ5BK87_9ASTR